MSEVLPQRKTPEHFWTTERLIRLLIMGMGLMFLALTISFWQQAEIKSIQQEIQQSQTEGRERGYILRAETCALQTALGLELGENCLDSNITKHYDESGDPTAGARSMGQKRNVRLLCDILAALEHPSQECLNVD